MDTLVGEKIVSGDAPVSLAHGDEILLFTGATVRQWPRGFVSVKPGLPSGIRTSMATHNLSFLGVIIYKPIF